MQLTKTLIYYNLLIWKINTKARNYYIGDVFLMVDNRVSPDKGTTISTAETHKELIGTRT